MSTTEISNMESKDYLSDLSTDLSMYFHMDATKQSSNFDESIEDMLTHLDEYCGLVDMIRSDTSLCLHSTVPIIHLKSKDMEAIFDKIDKLESFVNIVKQQFSDLEMLVATAEDDMGSLSSIKKVFQGFSLPSFFSVKKVPPPEATSDTKQSSEKAFSTPKIYQTEDYLGPPREVSDSLEPSKEQSFVPKQIPDSSVEQNVCENNS